MTDVLISVCLILLLSPGESKGYGFVEFNEPMEKVGKIKYDLDWSKVEGHTVHCDAIVDSTQSGITFQVGIALVLHFTYILMILI